MRLSKQSIIITISILIFVFSCSYEKINAPGQKKVHIINLNIDGEKRTAFIIRKKINRFSNIDSKNKIKIDINISNKKEVEEKNIQNKVTKYKLFMTAKVVVTDMGSGKKNEKTYNASQIYGVVERYSNTVYNAKKANDDLIEIISGEILDQLKIFYN